MEEIQQEFEPYSSFKVEHLIISSKDHIVFIDPDLDVDWNTSDVYDKNGPVDSAKHNFILNRAASIECIPNKDQKRDIRLNFKRMIAEGVARSFNHDYENAEKILDEAEIYINSRNIEIARFWQLVSSCICCIIAAIITLLLWGFRHILLAGIGYSAFYLILSALSGTIGATLSIILRMGNSNITSEADIKLHILEAVSRNIEGAIFGLFIALLIKIGILVPMFSSTGMTNIAMIAGGLIGGTSERWVPSLISQVETMSIEERRLEN